MLLYGTKGFVVNGNKGGRIMFHILFGALLIVLAIKYIVYGVMDEQNRRNNQNNGNNNTQN